MSEQVDTFLSSPVSNAGTQALRALWHAAHGEWDAAHEEAQSGNDAESAWVHALLHREEGDGANAMYWYRRAGKPVASGPIELERDAMIENLLAAQK